MKKKILGLILALTLIAPVTANAGFLRFVVDNFGFQLSLSANDTLDLFGALADDIGDMADRILLMADQIDQMADKILVMADKIVATEVLMAQLTTDMATIAADVATINANTSTGEVAGMYIDNAGQTDLYNLECPAFTMSDSPAEYVVYVSSSLTMNTNTISVLVRNRAELEALWPDLITLAANGKIYIGVKSVADNKISSLSNILGYNVL